MIERRADDTDTNKLFNFFVCNTGEGIEYYSPRLMIRFSLHIVYQLTHLLRKIAQLAEGLPPTLPPTLY